MMGRPQADRAAGAAGEERGGPQPWINRADCDTAAPLACVKAVSTGDGALGKHSVLCYDIPTYPACLCVCLCALSACVRLSAHMYVRVCFSFGETVEFHILTPFYRVGPVTDGANICLLSSLSPLLPVSLSRLELKFRL